MKFLKYFPKMKVFGARTTLADPLQKFKFRISVPGIPTSIGFTKLSGLSHEVTITEYDEGGFDYTHKLPGRNKVAEIVAERGAYADNAFQEVLKQTLTNPDMRTTVVVEYLNRYGTPVRTYKLAEAWVSKWEGSDFDAGSDDVAIEKMTIVFEYFMD